jgi:uncharacterized protein
MRLETDLTIITKIAAKKGDENWRFRSFLKTYHGSENEIDGIVHDLYQKISLEIDCTQCANCCRKMQPALDQEDIRDFSQSLGLDLKVFKEQYLIQDGEVSDKFRFNRQPCPFLKGNLCLNYQHRPQDCRSFPHLHIREFTSRIWEVVENYSICPLVFNVYEYLKRELWH